jgi:addiction module HigA family antidote
MRATLGTWELWITINEKTVMKDPVLNPVHPGEILLKDFLEPLAISQSRLAKDVHVPLGRIKELVLERRGISADTALRLARYFNTTPQFWLNLQTKFDLDSARLTEEKTILRTIQPSSALAAVA